MIAIKDMKEIPKTCCDEDKLCPLFNEETGTCNGVEEFIMTDTTMKRFPNCPLVEIEERKVGKWIKSGGSFRCSECIAMPEFTDIRTLKYCPNCGAEMVGYENG